MTLSTDDDALITTFGRLIEANGSLGRAFDRSLERHCGISHGTFEVLLRLSRADDEQLSMSALAQQVALTSGGITRLLDRLINAELVRRVPCPTDRRVQYAALTDGGRRKLEDALEVHAANLRHVFHGFSRRELKVLDQLLDRLRTAEPPAG